MPHVAFLSILCGYFARVTFGNMLLLVTFFESFQWKPRKNLDFDEKALDLLESAPRTIQQSFVAHLRSGQACAVRGVCGAS